MASSPTLKLFRAGKYVGSVKYLEDAAMAASMFADVVRYGHGGSVLWTEGKEGTPAADSYDDATETMVSRMTRGEWRHYQLSVGRPIAASSSGR